MQSDSDKSATTIENENKGSTVLANVRKWTGYDTFADTLMMSLPRIGREGGSFKEFMEASGEVLKENPLSTPFQFALAGLNTTAIAVGWLGLAAVAGSAVVMAPMALLGAVGIGAGPALATLAVGGIGLAAGLGGAITGMVTSYSMEDYLDPLERKYKAAYKHIDEKRTQEPGLHAGQGWDLDARMALTSSAPAPGPGLDGLDLRAAFTASAPRGVANDAPAAAPVAAQPATQNTRRNGM